MRLGASIRRNRRNAPGRLLSSAPIRALGKTLKSCQPQYREAAEAVRLILLTGCRSGEVLRLHWGKVQQDKRTLTSTKTGPREGLLSYPARNLLKTKKANRNFAHVFPLSQGPDALIGKIDNAWKRLHKLARLPDDNPPSIALCPSLAGAGDRA